MSNPIFNVDRRPCVHIADPISFGGNNATWGSADNYGAATIDLSNGNRLAGINTYQPIGVQRLIRNMQYHYERGIRRFMINSPLGTLVVENNFPAYGGIWSPMTQRVIEDYNGNKFVNPYLVCWPGRSTIPTIAEAENPATSFISNGRGNEFYQHLRTWLVSSSQMGYNVGLDGTTPMPNKLGDVELYIYTGFGIPYKNGSVSYSSNYVHVMGNGADFNAAWLNNTTSGFKMPDPENDQDHKTYLESEWLKWFECGVNGIGQDVGVYGWNHRHGCWVYQDSFIPANHDRPLTNMRKWYEKYYNNIPVGFNPGQRMSSKPFKYFLENFPWDNDPDKILNKTTTNSFPTPNTNETFSFWSPFGAYADSNSTAYKGSWMHYTPYIVLPASLTNFINGSFPNPSQYSGADPNHKWVFDTSRTEIHLLVTGPSFPFTDGLDSTLNNLSNNMNSTQTQTVIENCTAFWKNYIDRGYVYMPAVYWNGYSIDREINKRLLEYIGVWPSGKTI